MFSNRTFGVEIEFIGSRSVVHNALLNAGLTSSVESYNHGTRPHWKVTTDGSVGNGYDNGGELVSPILHGEQGLQDLSKACRAMVAAGIRVNTTCGVHVHVGAADLSPQEIAATCIRYARHESTFDSIMPRSRRLSNNQYCRTITRNTITVQGATTVENVARMFHSDRYVKLNVMSWLRQKTLEFRQHSGSINATKICNWVKVCTKFVDTTVTAFRSIQTHQETVQAPSSSVYGFHNPYRWNTKKYNICDMLRHGSTIQEIVDRTGCPASSVGSMISQIKNDANTPNVVRTGRRGHYVYRFTDAATSTVRTVTSYRDADYYSVFELGAFHGLEDAIVGYYEERAMELAN